VRLLWCAEFSSVGEAFALEKKVQGWSRAKKRALIAGDVEAHRLLSHEGVKPSSMHVSTADFPTVTPW